MKNLFFLSLTFFTLLCSCKRDDNQTSETENITYPEESFFDGYMTTTGFSQHTTSSVNAALGEMGLFFTPTVNGKIAKIKIRLPQASNSLRVTIWNTNDGSVISSNNYIVSSGNTEYTFSVDNINLLKNGNYAITMLTNQVYYNSKSDNSATFYPVTIGHIAITAFKADMAINTNVPSLPTSVFKDRYMGNLYFIFQQTN